jgi:hypothetical protein
MEKTCKNCNEIIIGRYCHICSQEDKNLPKFLDFISNSFINILEFDFRIIRSLRLLLFKPSVLTSEYWNGKRITQTKPLRLLAFSLLFMIFSGSVVDYFANSKLENSGLITRYLAFAFIPVTALLFKLFFRRKKEYHFTHFFIFSLHLVAGMTIISVPFLVFDVISQDYTIILGLSNLVLVLIWHTLFIFYLFKEKIIKTILVSFSVFIITGALSSIIGMALGFIFPDQFANEEEYEKMLIQTDKFHFESIEKINNQIDSLNIFPFKNKDKIDSLIIKRDRKEKKGNVFRKLKEKGDKIKSKTDIK